ncbi:MAG: DUF2959 family protein [Desulfovibrionales bacterium]
MPQFGISRWFILCFLPFLAGCYSLHYDSIERLDLSGGEVLREQVREAQMALAEAKREVAALRELFLSTVAGKDNYPLGLKSLKRKYEQSLKRAWTAFDEIEQIRITAGNFFSLQRVGPYAYERLDRAAAFFQLRKEYMDMMIFLARTEETTILTLGMLHQAVLYLEQEHPGGTGISMQIDAEHMQKELHVVIDHLERAVAQTQAFIRKM